MNVEQHFLETTKGVFRNYKSLAEKSFLQLKTDSEYYYSPDSESNSVAVLITHMSGNMISRWTDFLTTDGEKPFRNRDQEFVNGKETSAQLMEDWNKGWKVFMDTLENLTGEDLLKTITIRQEKLTVVQALIRQTAHYSYHVGQIVYLIKQIRTAEWKSLSIPKNQSSNHLKGSYLDDIK